MSFRDLAPALDAFARSGRAAARERLVAAGHGQEAASTILRLLTREYATASRGRWAGRLFDVRTLAKAIGVPVFFGPPPTEQERRDPGGPMALVAPDGCWVGAGCLECAALSFAERWCPPEGDLAPAIRRRRRTAILLAEATVARLVALVAKRRAGWAVGSIAIGKGRGIAPPHPGCVRCLPRRPHPAPRLGPARRVSPAAARTALDRLGVVRLEEVQERRTSYRDLPLVAVSWTRAQRAEDGALVVQQGTQIGGGASGDQRRLTARVECIERILVGTRAPDLRGRSLASLAGRGLDPDAWGLFSRAQYATVPFRRLRPGEPLDWARAWDFARGRFIWVPIDLVHGGSGRLLPASSTGSAAHGSLAGVVVAGLLEIIEREALQLAWYRGAPLALVPRGALQGEAAARLDWIERNGFRAHVRWTEGRGRRHVVAVVGEVVRATRGLVRGGTVFTAGASGRFAHAAERALGELVTAIEVLHAQGAPPIGDRPDLRAAFEVNAPEIIHRLYLHPAMRPALDFFLDGPPLAGPPPGDREDSARDLLRDLVGEGLRPLLVDCTVPEIAPLCAGKMILADALQHSFATGLLRLGGGHLAGPPRRVLRPPPAGYRPIPGETTVYPFPLA